MKIYRKSLKNCSEASGLVVVIDVLRAFSTAAYAFAAGVEYIVVVGTVEEALELRREIPGSRVVGEVMGLPHEDFDHGNSPTEISGLELKGVPLIQRTSAGTQGMVKCANADILLAGSFCCADATARYIVDCSPETVTFVLTGVDRPGWGDEDIACADYIETILRGEPADVPSIVRGVRASPPGRVFASPARPEFPSSDLDLCLMVDRFDFVLRAERVNGRLVMNAIH